MDILRRELNGIYSAQHLERESLSKDVVIAVRGMAEMMVKVSNACAVITDASRDSSYVYAGGFGRLMGFSEDKNLCVEVASSDEDEIYNRIHPEDLVEKRMLEYEFFKMVDAVEDKEVYKATCRIRMMDRGGMYRYVDNSTQVIKASPGGKIWLILCCYDLSPVQEGDGIVPRVVNNDTGEVVALSFDDRRKNVLTVREKEILRLVQEGMPSKQIADRLGISVHTVSRHRQNIIEKLSVGNSIEAVMAASAMKLL